MTQQTIPSHVLLTKVALSNTAVSHTLNKVAHCRQQKCVQYRILRYIFTRCSIQYRKQHTFDSEIYCPGCVFFSTKHIRTPKGCGNIANFDKCQVHEICTLTIVTLTRENAFSTLSSRSSSSSSRSSSSSTGSSGNGDNNSGGSSGSGCSCSCICSGSSSRQSCCAPCVPVGLAGPRIIRCE